GARPPRRAPLQPAVQDRLRRDAGDVRRIVAPRGSAAPALAAERDHRTGGGGGGLLELGRLPARVRAQVRRGAERLSQAVLKFSSPGPLTNLPRVFNLPV